MLRVIVKYRRRLLAGVRLIREYSLLMVDLAIFILSIAWELNPVVLMVVPSDFPVFEYSIMLFSILTFVFLRPAIGII